MQKRLEISGRPADVSLPPDFPLVAYRHTQTYRSLQDMHTHCHAEIGVCLDGSGVFFMGEKVYPFAKGDISFIHPGPAHIAQSAEESPSHWWFISYDPLFFGGESETRDFVFRDADCLALLHMLLAELERPDGDREVCAMLLRLCLRFLGRQTGEVPSLEGAAELSAILPAMQMMLQRYGEPLEAETLAAACHMSESHFRALFRGRTGVSPLAYLTRLRMLAAADRLRQTDRPITAIAADVGYGNLSSFNRQFKSTYGITPREYRTMNDPIRDRTV